MRPVEYRYELRRGEEVVATGRINREQPLEIGEQIEIAGRTGSVHTIEPLFGKYELRLVIRLEHKPSAA